MNSLEHVRYSWTSVKCRGQRGSAHMSPVARLSSVLVFSHFQSPPPLLSGGNTHRQESDNKEVHSLHKGQSICASDSPLPLKNLESTESATVERTACVSASFQILNSDSRLCLKALSPSVSRPPQKAESLS